MRTSCRYLCLLVSCLLWAVGLAAQTPNTLLVVADDLGVDSIGCYGLGTNPPPTPTIDGLAAAGIRFTASQANPLCSPTRAALYTGRHAFRTGVGTALPMSAGGLAASEVLLPEILAPAGIRTGLFGKWHLGNDLGPLTPTAEGFGTFTGALGGALQNYFQWQKVENGTASQSTTYATTDVVDEALSFVGASTQPWFVVLSFHAGHSPYHAPPAALHTQNLAGLDPATNPVPFHRAMVEAMDRELGRFLASLPAATRANTNVVFVGDNGTASEVVSAPFDPARSKGTVYQGGVRVPLIVSGPAVGGAPRVEPALVHVVDLFATLAALQGVNARSAVPATVALDALDLTPLLAAAGQPSPRAHAYSVEFTGTVPMAAAGDSEVIRNARYALLRFVRPNLSVREELHDLATDPFQTNNLLLQPLSAAAADAYRELSRELARLRELSWTSSYGIGCSGGGIAPQLAVLAGTRPALGTSFGWSIHGLGAAAPASLLGIGFQGASWNGQALPLALDGYGMPGCSLWTDLAATQVLVTAGGTASWSVAVPNQPGLLGTQLYAQGFPLVAAANPAGVLATAALEAVVGR